jgi:phosphoglycolate phosphatase-like HAD superfamily hydrolase
MALSAIIWDYDGTLIDSTKKNMLVTVEILKNFIPDIGQNLPPALTSVEEYIRANHKYQNWRELYKQCYNLTDSQIDAAGKLWSPYQLESPVIPDMFAGLRDIVKFFGDIKQGICSQNCSVNIGKTLAQFGILEYFAAIIGYEEVSFIEQKPNPAGFLKCLDMLNISLKSSTIIYIGDHQEDVVFGKNAATLLKNAGHDVEVKCIAVDYSGSKPLDWTLKPDFVASSACDIQTIINALHM